MVGIFSKLSSKRIRHRRLRSTADAVETSQTNLETRPSLPVNVVAHGFEIADEFIQNIERPIEPLNHDEPIRCPAPEPSILNDGRKWKARMSTANTRVRNELPVIPEQPRGSESSEIKSGSCSRENKRISPSLSAPEDVLLTLL